MASNRCAESDGLHVALIMDGNGRWATSRGLPRLAGHRAGVAAVRRVVERAPDLDIRLLTLYAFSSDNWRRPASEVDSIFFLLRTFLRLEAARLRGKGVQLQVIGRRNRLPPSVRHEIERAEQVTAAGHRLQLRLAIDYSSRAAVAHAAALAALALCPGDQPTSETLTWRLGQAITNQSRDVDLLIRTGGEQRLSDFLLWECAYAELLFTPIMWPDFDGETLASALNDFRLRERRFGGLPTPLPPTGTPATVVIT